MGGDRRQTRENHWRNTGVQLDLPDLGTGIQKKKSELGFGAILAWFIFVRNLEEPWEKQKLLASLFPGPCSCHSGCPPVLKGKEQERGFKGDLGGLNPEDAGQDGACGEGPRLRLDGQAAPSSGI